MYAHGWVEADRRYMWLVFLETLLPCLQVVLLGVSFFEPRTLAVMVGVLGVWLWVVFLRFEAEATLRRLIDYPTTG